MPTEGTECQIDAGEGTESFVCISAAVFELSRKSGRGGISPPPLAGLGLTGYFIMLHLRVVWPSNNLTVEPHLDFLSRSGTCRMYPGDTAALAY